MKHHLLISSFMIFFNECFTQQPKLVLPIGHNQFINSACFSPNNQQILSSSFDASARIWDTKSGALLKTIARCDWDVSSATYSPDGKRILTACDSTIKIWDAKTGAWLQDIRGNFNWIYSVSYSPAGEKIIGACDDSTAKIWDLQSAELVAVFKGHKNIVKYAAFSPDGKKIVTGSEDTSAIVWDTKSFNPLLILKGHKGIVNCSSFSPDGKQIVTASDDSSISIWNAQTGALLANLRGHTNKVNTAFFSNDSKYIISSSDDSTSGVWDAKDYRLLHILKGHKHEVTDAKFSFDDKMIVTASKDTTIRIWNTRTMKLIAECRGHTGRGLYETSFSADGKKIITKSWDQVPKIWDAECGGVIGDLKDVFDYGSDFSADNTKYLSISDENNTIEVKSDPKDGFNLLYTFFPVDSNDFFIGIPSGYYMCTKNASKLLHYVTDDLKVITFDQLDIKYNRPDLILKTMGCKDTLKIIAYNKAYGKRIKKLGIDTTAFQNGYSVPEADFANRDNIGYVQNNPMLSLHIKGFDSIYKLDRFNVWVNEVPVYGQKGISLKNKNTYRIDTSVAVKLSDGEDLIEASITNVNGIESYHIPLQVDYIPEIRSQEKTYFIGIGIDRFADTAYNLNYSTKDIRDLALKLKKKYGEDFRVDTLFNEFVMVDSVKKLKKILQHTTVNDKVIIAYSGHGLLNDSLDYYLSTYDINFNKPEENGLPYDELENLLDSIPARKKLLLIDACHSGEVDKEEFQAMNRIADSLGLIKGSTGGSPVGTGAKRLGLNSSFELMQNLFVNVGRSTGATIISAAAGNQYALEGVDHLRNGIFTYCILEAMNTNRTIKVSELKKQVGKRVEEITKGLQKPTSRNETIAVDWEVW